MKTKLQKSRMLLAASQRIRKAENECNQLRERLDIHESYLKVINALVPRHGLDCCDDGLLKDIEEQAVALEFEHHEEQPKGAGCADKALTEHP